MTKYFIDLDPAPGTIEVPANATTIDLASAFPESVVKNVQLPPIPIHWQNGSTIQWQALSDIEWQNVLENARLDVVTVK